MIKAHMTFLFTQRLYKVSVAIILFVGFFFMVISEYNIGRSSLLFQNELYTYEYVLQGFTVLKMVLLLYMAIIWVYADHISRYDVYLYSRYPHVFVFVTKFIVVNGITVCMGGILGCLFVFVWTLYPMPVSSSVVYTYFGYLFLFILVYNMLFLLFSQLTKHLYGLFIPVFGYLFSMISMDTNNSVETGISGTNYSQIIFPDIVYSENEFMFMYGGLFVFSLIVFCGYVVIHIFIKNDRI